jgi:hypothetical protein
VVACIWVRCGGSVGGWVSRKVVNLEARVCLDIMADRDIVNEKNSSTFLLHTAWKL